MSEPLVHTSRKERSDIVSQVLLSQKFDTILIEKLVGMQKIFCQKIVNIIFNEIEKNRNRLTFAEYFAAYAH